MIKEGWIHMEKEFIIMNEQGLHARPASELVKLANSFSSDLTLIYDGKEVDLKSIMGVLSLGVRRGTTIAIKAIGEDNIEAMKAIQKLLESFNLR